MARKSRTQYAILGFLASAPATGYEIRKQLRDISTIWYESYGQIYPSLKRLTEQGFATRETRDGAKGSNKYIYTITDKGRKHLQDWLEEPVRFTPVRHELGLRIYFAKHSTRAILIEQLKRFKVKTLRDLEHNRELYKKYIVNKDPLISSDHAFMTISQSKYVLDAQLAWCEDMLEHIQSKPN